MKRSSNRQYHIHTLDADLKFRIGRTRCRIPPIPNCNEYIVRLNLFLRKPYPHLRPEQLKLSLVVRVDFNLTKQRCYLGMGGAILISSTHHLVSIGHVGESVAFLLRTGKII